MRTPGGHGARTEWRGGARRGHAIKMMGGPHSQHRLPDSRATTALGLSESLFQPLGDSIASTFIFVPNKALNISHNWPRFFEKGGQATCSHYIATMIF